MCSFAFVAYRMGAKPFILALFLLSYPVLGDLANGNIEWMPMLGFVLPPQIGLMFVLIKPQVGVGVSIFWLLEAWREGGVRQVARTFAPVIILFLGSFLLYGFWPLHFLNTLALANKIQSDNSLDYNASLWPIGVVVGLALLITAIKKRNYRLSIMSSPFLSPYALMATYATSLLAWIKKPWIFLVIWAITWIPVVLRVVGE
jgi:hypothetical protein